MLHRCLLVYPHCFETADVLWSSQQNAAFSYLHPNGATESRTYCVFISFKTRFRFAFAEMYDCYKYCIQQYFLWYFHTETPLCSGQLIQKNDQVLVVQQLGPLAQALFSVTLLQRTHSESSVADFYSKASTEAPWWSTLVPLSWHTQMWLFISHKPP